MRKLKLEPEELVVETFDTLLLGDGEKGTVHGNATEAHDGCSVDVACSRVESCPAENCWEQPTNDWRQRQCVTPYVACGTDAWTCRYC
jgi:hypothetical protein